MSGFGAPGNENTMVSDLVLLFATLMQRVSRVMAMIARDEDTLLVQIAADSLTEPEKQIAKLLEEPTLADALGTYTATLASIAVALKNLETYDYDTVGMVAGVVGVENDINMGYLEAVLDGSLPRREEKAVKQIALFFEQLPPAVAGLARTMGQITRYSNEANILDLLSRHSRTVLKYTAYLLASHHFLDASYSASATQDRIDNAKGLVRRMEAAADIELRLATEALFAIVPEIGLE
jgi:hypothetical protein